MTFLSQTRLGLMGHYYSGMLDIATDLLQVSGRFGIHIEMLEVDELSALRRSISPADIESRVSHFRDVFEVSGECSQAELERAAQTSVALDRFAEHHALGMMAYYYRGTGVPENEDTMSSIILGTSMLTSRGVVVAGEYEVKNVIAMKILDLLDAGGSFTEFYAMDFAANLVLMGHDGPGHSRIAEGRVKVKPLQVYHGKVGKGLSVEMAVRYGPVTLLSVVEDAAHGFKLLIAKGDSVQGETLAIGNTNSFYRFPLSAQDFVERWNAQGPAHHCAIGTGNLTSQLEKLAQLLRIPAVVVC
jgi:L-arabinose isomerase